MKRINACFAAILLLLCIGFPLFYWMLKFILGNSLTGLLGAAVLLQDENLVSAVTTPENQQALQDAGRQYLEENGYGMTGMDHLLRSAEFIPVMIIMALFLLIVLATVYWTLKKERDSLRADAFAIADFLGSRVRDESVAVPMVKSAEMNVVMEATEQFVEAKAHQISLVQQEKEHLNEFTQNVYHQIKTPLAGLRLYLEKFQEDKQDHSAEWFGILDRLTDQVTTLLNLGKLEANVVNVVKKAGDFAILVEDAVYSINLLAEHKNIKIHCDLPEEAPFEFNYFWLREAVENLLKNACEHSPAGSEIRVILNKTSQGYRLTVDDQAGGLGSTNAFGRYVSSGSPGKYGIGLHLSKVIVENHFGIIEVKDNGIGGSSFIINLPILKGKIPYL